MTFIEGDRVRIAGTESAIGTVTKDRSTGGFEHFIGILWDTGAFGFANPNKVEHVETIPGMTEQDRQALGEAYRSALDAVDPIGFVTSHNRTETGTEAADWQTRAESAEAANDRIRGLHAPATVLEAWGSISRSYGNSDACKHCTSEDDSTPTLYPCPTIRALDADQ